jgi:hypothetical protein
MHYNDTFLLYVEDPRRYTYSHTGMEQNLKFDNICLNCLESTFHITHNYIKHIARDENNTASEA